MIFLTVFCNTLHHSSISILHSLLYLREAKGVRLCSYQLHRHSICDILREMSLWWQVWSSMPLESWETSRNKSKRTWRWEWISLPPIVVNPWSTKVRWDWGWGFYPLKEHNMIQGLYFYVCPYESYKKMLHRVSYCMKLTKNKTILPSYNWAP